jgi:hypothetical protein
VHEAYLRLVDAEAAEENLPAPIIHRPQCRHYSAPELCQAFPFILGPILQKRFPIGTG